MISDFLTKQYVDHFLQVQIIEKLMVAPNPVRFSELKEDGVDNSLFMYHANKLIDRGIIEKRNDGFRLTIKGARWVNYAGTGLFGKKILPKPLVQCIISNNDHVLIASRTGSMRGFLNEYMLPGTLHHAGTSANENIRNYVQDLFIETTPEPRPLTIAEVIIKYDDGFVHHTLSHIFELELPDKFTTNDNKKFSYDWYDKKAHMKTDLKFANSQIVPLIIEKQQNLKPYELFELNHKS